jgi:hypothetical protein
MRAHVLWFLAVLFTGLLNVSVLAQASPLEGVLSRLEDGVDTPLLLAAPEVKKEIRLTDEQSVQVRQIVQEVRDKYQPELRKVQGDRERYFLLLADSAQETRDRVNKALPGILNPDQLKRLHQIDIQVNGIVSFKRPEVQRELKLTEEQKTEIRRIGQGLRQDVAEAFRDVPTAPLRRLPAAVRRARELKDTATQKAVGTLNEDQKTTWKQMTGDRFDLKIDFLNRQGVGR